MGKPHRPRPTMINDPSAQRLIANRQLNKAIETLHGIVTGVIADGHLHDMEIRLLQTWLTDNADAAAVWPGSLVFPQINAVLADGIVTAEERAHLLSVLQAMAHTDFSATGSATAEPTTLPVNDAAPVTHEGRAFCLTGEFWYGTRRKCEDLVALKGGQALDNVTKKLHYLVIGTNVSPAWAHTTYGRKIERAIELQQQGHPIQIVTERHWLKAVGIE